MSFRINASELRQGMWLLFANARQNQRVVETETTRDGEVKAYLDYGNGGEPATGFFEPDEYLVVSTPGELASRDGERFFLRVLQSPDGFYLGTVDDEGLPFSRESDEYFPTADEAASAWRLGNWTQRLTP